MRQSEIIYIIKNIKSVSSFKKQYCGQHLGTGTYREVFIFAPDDKWVVKIETDMTQLEFINALEYHNWNWNRFFTAFNKFLAPCLTISKCGRVLIQRRVTREIDGRKKSYPTHLPNWITDTKRQNFGWLGKQFVCCDYPHLIDIQFRMRKVKFLK